MEVPRRAVRGAPAAVRVLDGALLAGRRSAGGRRRCRLLAAGGRGQEWEQRGLPVYEHLDAASSPSDDPKGGAEACDGVPVRRWVDQWQREEPKHGRDESREPRGRGRGVGQLPRRQCWVLGFQRWRAQGQLRVERPGDGAGMGQGVYPVLWRRCRSGHAVWRVSWSPEYSYPVGLAEGEGLVPPRYYAVRSTGIP